MVLVGRCCCVVHITLTHTPQTFAKIAKNQLTPQTHSPNGISIPAQHPPRIFHGFLAISCDEWENVQCSLLPLPKTIRFAILLLFACLLAAVAASHLHCCVARRRCRRQSKWERVKTKQKTKNTNRHRISGSGPGIVCAACHLLYGLYAAYRCRCLFSLDCSH